MAIPKLHVIDGVNPASLRNPIAVKRIARKAPMIARCAENLLVAPIDTKYQSSPVARGIVSASCPDSVTFPRKKRGRVSGKVASKNE